MQPVGYFGLSQLSFQKQVFLVELQHTQNKTKKANSDKKTRALVGLSLLEVVFYFIKANISSDILWLKLHPEFSRCPLSTIPDRENMATIIHKEMIRASSA